MSDDEKRIIPFGIKSFHNECRIIYSATGSTNDDIFESVQGVFEIALENYGYSLILLSSKNSPKQSRFWKLVQNPLDPDYQHNPGDPRKWTFSAGTAFIQSEGTRNKMYEATDGNYEQLKEQHVTLGINLKRQTEDLTRIGRFIPDHISFRHGLEASIQKILKEKRRLLSPQEKREEIHTNEVFKPKLKHDNSLSINTNGLELFDYAKEQKRKPKSDERKLGYFTQVRMKKEGVYIITQLHPKKARPYLVNAIGSFIRENDLTFSHIPHARYRSSDELPIQEYSKNYPKPQTHDIMITLALTQQPVKIATAKIDYTLDQLSALGGESKTQYTYRVNLTPNRNSLDLWTHKLNLQNPRIPHKFSKAAEHTISRISKSLHESLIPYIRKEGIQKDETIESLPF